MTNTRRGLRSGTSATTTTAATTSKPILPPQTTAVPSPITFTQASASTSTPRLEEPILLLTRGTKLPHLSSPELSLLRQKQHKLSSTAPSTHSRCLLPTALVSTLIFAQHEAGTAVLIHPSGWVLTCAHCFGDSAQEYEDDSKKRWLLFYNGDAVLVECRVWDGKRDLALLKIIAVETDQKGVPSFSCVGLYEGEMRYRMRIICIGQPGRDDLESKDNRRTAYNLVEVSEGVFRGMVKGRDAQDNEDIGTLMHDAWTYWGHSGAPLLRESDGRLVGLHSSWDDGTGMRHGVPGVAVREFWGIHLPDSIEKEASSSSTTSEMKKVPSGREVIDLT